MTRGVASSWNTRSRYPCRQSPSILAGTFNSDALQSNRVVKYVINCCVTSCGPRVNNRGNGVNSVPFSVDEPRFRFPRDTISVEDVKLGSKIARNILPSSH